MATRIQLKQKKMVLVISSLLALAAAGCSLNAAAQAPATPPTTPTVAAPPAGVAPPATVRPDPAAPRPFAEIIKDAKLIPGYFNLYQKDDKVWVEIRPEQLDSPFFFQLNSTRGIGEGGQYPNWMLRSHIAEFKKQGSVMQLIAKNHRFNAKPGTAIARAVKESFSDSLLGWGAVVSAPHPERKSILVDANGIFLADISGTATRLETVFRLPYAYDARNSGFVDVRSTEDMTTFNVTAHYSLAKLPAPPLTPSPTPTPAPPANLEDNRSMFLGYYYTLSKLPEQPMAARVADSRVGHFVGQHWNYTDDIAPFPRQYIVNRWRLEKKDPNAAMSEPKQPIVFWLDKNIPVKYRAKVAEGVVEWNKAFENIGFKNAIQAKQQEDNAEFDNNDTRHASIRWYTDTSDGALAIGPSRTDPRTGEILDADISFSDGWTRLPRRRAVEQLTSVAQGNNHEHLKAHQHSDTEIMQSLARGEMSQFCEYESHAMEEVRFALDLLAARGDIDPESPEAEEIVLEQLKNTAIHEVGHTLGLQHNFRASTIYTLEQMEDVEFTRKRCARPPLAGSRALPRPRPSAGCRCRPVASGS